MVVRSIHSVMKSNLSANKFAGVEIAEDELAVTPVILFFAIRYFLRWSWTFAASGDYML